MSEQKLTKVDPHDALVIALETQRNNALSQAALGHQKLAEAHNERVDLNGEIVSLRDELAACQAELAELKESVDIELMVNRFLAWRLPDDFCPDAGISFKADYNENTDHPMKHEPTGTNLFDADQARQMILHILDKSIG